MPDPQGNPTEAELITELGWDDDVTEYEGEPVAAAAAAAIAPPDAVGTAGAPPAPEVPAPTIQAPPLPTSTPSPVPDYQELYRQQAADAQRKDNEQQVRTQINGQASTYFNQMVAAETSEAVARDAAERYATGEWHRYRAEKAEQENVAGARQQVAQQFATQYNVPIAELISYPDPSTMEAAAKRRQQESGRLATLEEKVRTATLAPVQDLDSGQGSGGISDAQKKMQYATGQIDLDATEYHRLFGS